MICQSAPRLLKERREAAQRGDTRRINEIDTERLLHADKSPCEGRCWTAAIKAADEVLV